MLAGLLGLLGMWLFDKDYRVAGIQYIVSGICVLIGISLYGIMGFVFYIIAGVFAFIEKDKSAQLSTTSSIINNVHYFGDNSNIDNVPQVTMKNNNTYLWTIPFITIVLIFIISFVGSSGFALASAQSSDALEINNVSIQSEGYSMYTVSCDITPHKSFSYLSMKVIFYDSNNAVIGDSSLVWNTNNPTQDQIIKASGTAMTNNANLRPARAEIYLFDDALETDPNDAIKVQNVTIN
ncbi:hypothetical protein NL43_04250 [Methanosphaera sp. WGK6]|nr:hypothetical protein NL43_04250 [Methanosphaera sp. WGK6]